MGLAKAGSAKSLEINDLQLCDAGRRGTTGRRSTGRRDTVNRLTSALYVLSRFPKVFDGLVTKSFANKILHCNDMIPCVVKSRADAGGFGDIFGPETNDIWVENQWSAMIFHLGSRLATSAISRLVNQN